MTQFLFKFLLIAGLLGMSLLSSMVNAHHVLGRPSYSLNEDSTTPPSMQVETQIGEYFVTYMVFPAFPVANEPGRVNLYASRIDNGAPLNVDVRFSVRNDSLFNDDEELLGVQAMDDNVYRQGFEFKQNGDYIIRASFQKNGQPYDIDFPLRIGEPAAFGPIGISVGIIVMALITVNLLQRKRLLTDKIRSNNEAKA